ncbi:MAG: hypothetical protein ACYCXA_06560 [Actinomycetes bacterium]
MSPRPSGDRVITPSPGSAEDTRLPRLAFPAAPVVDAAKASTQTLRMVGEVTHRVRAPLTITGLTLSGTTVAWTQDVPGTRHRQDVHVLDLVTGRERVVYRSRWPTGTMDGRVRLTGHWLVVTDMSRIPSDSDLWVDWAIVAVDLATGRAADLASTDGTKTQGSPAVTTAGGVVTWSEWPADPNTGSWLRSTDVNIHFADLTTGRRWTIPSLPRAARTFQVDAGLLYYVLDYGPEDGGSYVMARSMDGSGTARRVSPSDSAWAVDARSGRVAWAQPAWENPKTIWVAGREGKGPLLRVDPGLNWGPTLGDRLLAWRTINGSIDAMPVTGGTPYPVYDTFENTAKQRESSWTGADQSTDGLRVAYATGGWEDTPGHPTDIVIHVVTVEIVG